MLRITEISNGERAKTYKLEGKLLEPWLGEVRKVCVPSIARLVCLDLSSVVYVDAAGINLLRELTKEGVSITACSAFVAELLHVERS